MTFDLSIIIVNWNSKEYLDSCLSSIRDNILGLKFEVIVVDNASYDGSELLIQKKFPWIKYIQSTVNGGFSFANNIGARAANGGVLLFLNPDTEIVEDAVIRVYRTVSGNDRIGVASCIILNSDGSVQTSCVAAYPRIINQVLDSEILRNLFPESRLWGNAILFKPGSGFFPVETLSGAFLMMRKEVFNEIGGFEEDYFMYAEDRDLCYKVAKAGYMAVLEKSAVTIHHGGGSSASQRGSRISDIMMRESTYKFFRKHYFPLYAWTYKICIGISAFVRLSLITGFFPMFWLKNRALPVHSFRKWIHTLTWAFSRPR